MRELVAGIDESKSHHQRDSRGQPLVAEHYCCVDASPLYEAPFILQVTAQSWHVHTRVVFNLVVCLPAPSVFYGITAAAAVILFFLDIELFMACSLSV